MLVHVIFVNICRFVSLGIWQKYAFEKNLLHWSNQKDAIGYVKCLFVLKDCKIKLHILNMHSKMHKCLFSSGFLWLQTCNWNSQPFYDAWQLTKQTCAFICIVFLKRHHAKPWCWQHIFYIIPLDFTCWKYM